MIVKLLTEHHLEFRSLKGGCTGSSESIHVKLPHCWKSHALAPYSNHYNGFTIRRKVGDLDLHCFQRRILGSAGHICFFLCFA